MCVQFSEITGPTEAKFHAGSLLDRRKNGKLIQMIRSFVVFSLLSALGTGAFSKDFTTICPHSTGLLAGFEN